MHKGQCGGSPFIRFYSWHIMLHSYLYMLGTTTKPCGYSERILFLDLGLAVTESNTKKVQKQDDKKKTLKKMQGWHAKKYAKSPIPTSFSHYSQTVHGNLLKRTTTSPTFTAVHGCSLVLRPLPPPGNEASMTQQCALQVAIEVYLPGSLQWYPTLEGVVLCKTS